MTAPSPMPGYSKAPRGLFVLPRVARVFTGTAISPSPPPRQWPSRSTIHAGRNLPDKGLRYLRHFVTPRLSISRRVGGVGHFCRPLHVAVQVGPYHTPREPEGSGVWSLRIPTWDRSQLRSHDNAPSSALRCQRARVRGCERGKTYFEYGTSVRPFLLIVRTGCIVTPRQTK